MTTTIDLEWKVIYVGSAESSEHDQVLEEVVVGPVPVGVHRFELEADAPNSAVLDPQQALGVTVVLIACSYQEQEFVRIGYYVNNELPSSSPEDDPALLPDPIPWNQVVRTTLADKPRVTRFPIVWQKQPTDNHHHHHHAHHQNDYGDENDENYTMDWKMRNSPLHHAILNESMDDTSRMVTP